LRLVQNLYHTNKFNSFGHYNIINKFIVECLDDEAVTGYLQWLRNTAASGTSYTVTGLNSNTAYTFKVGHKMEFINS
jgi:hypothetical protein